MFILSIAALVCATLFASAALYISLVEHPARLGLRSGLAARSAEPAHHDPRRDRLTVVRALP